ncbi:MAG: hypothetical protein EA349_08545 [Halomonadaceae bacterium]|nr:MAG: hypothetical protein EA349_08545 [Halomonadaceae bacterium]
MTVKFLDSDQSPSGCGGFDVSVEVNGSQRQTFFSTRGMPRNSMMFQHEKLRAQAQNAQWEAEAAFAVYRKQVSTNSPETEKHTGVGVHGLTLDFFSPKQDVWEPVFVVHGHNGKEPRRFSIKGKYLSTAWTFAVNCWADEHQVLDEDRQRLLDAPPAPDQFKALRHVRNQQGNDIGVEVLGDVFAERRAALQAERGMSRTRITSKEYPADTRSAREKADDVMTDVAAWFEQEMSSK